MDLAGSERVARTAASGLRLQEARNINKSLLGLSQLVKALEKASITGGGGAAAQQQHLPYRDTKLTQLLQPSLSGAVILTSVLMQRPSDNMLQTSVK